MQDNGWQSGRLFEGRRSHRRRARWIVPSSLAVAAAVVAVAAGLSLGVGEGGDDLSTATLPAQPPALGDFPLAPPADPLTPAPSVTGPATPTPSAGRKTPGASRGGDGPAGLAGVQLDLTAGAVPATVDLSAEGSRDWVHWGEQNVWSLERRRGGGFAILEGTPGRSRERHEQSEQRFAWRGGDPVASTDGVRSGIRTCGAGNGFTLSAPATRGGTRTLRLYVGVFQARGVLTAKVGGETATARLDDRDTAFTVYTVTYRAERDGRIDVSWKADTVHGGGGCRGVALQAASLQ
ncbi:hypothetical protein [Spirilliplanes yamanashiensis]|uniref:Uncharacterized protein n=1 Tax=Spirilliplanes yamanashiensis TaxID=42233 RepID=A0A8J3Y9H7_9ACTN|nr:hypothetical protein [Spirilliplanes yamanashiensis]MDP9817676.1 hypothetical protein [Spirilliplanes yamanashiensis]GIJ04486.1 hypothetical protein Sya03_38380 [Spirilliplanes yamanashiensis]